ncbi:MAG TPA: 3-oxoacyl-[acyl-carrier-protein] synthase III C-terminal domain-containing protein [Bryobacteraceae bacterium]|nr:3-oxoacyl-[acyl-carrier-protein] synthase III C-terminal domain-containing protein [Bryobacteraceae bacterium]HXJ39386.1 3-oxoacyl-[acyl-carrier-protein] synthase III C-terminal domain-containing protein [Bryobacteraceae bacterium]
MKIVSAASAFPKNYYTQEALLDALQKYWGDRLENPQLLSRLHSRARVDGRHLALPMIEYYGLSTWGNANRAWFNAAEELGSAALCRSLARAGLEAARLGSMIFMSITGVSSPSVDARLINRMGLPPHIRRVPVFGLGCVGGAAGIARAADYVRAYPNQIAALVSVETCSLTLQRDDTSAANLISSGLFGDGAASVLVAGADVEIPGIDIVDSRSTFYPGTEDVMGWDISEKGFRIILSPRVPDVIRENLGRDVDAFLGDHGLRRRDIANWIMHTGGPKILEATQEALGVDEAALAPSWECLRRVGNLSSASVLVVLEDYVTRHRSQPGSWSLLGATGPGFCSELVLLRS